MNLTFEESRKKVQQLVNKFDEHFDSYKNQNYNETNVRTQFINPFFELLGWDVYNKEGIPEEHRDVIPESRIKMNGGNKAPDYSFTLSGNLAFFVEAKKPAVDILTNPEPAIQLRSYGWSCKDLNFSILTNFDNFIVYDCRNLPNNKDKVHVGQILKYNYKEFYEKWEEIYSYFSKTDFYRKNKLNKELESKKTFKGTTTVDQEFLKEISHWREILAKDIAKLNPTLTNRNLNFAVQKTIDRIIFLRMCEDRGIEDDYNLKAVTNGVRIYRRLFEKFQKADDKYNSGLFYLREEKGREDLPDDITPFIEIGDETIKKIINSLYHPYSQYKFSVMPADILGNVYEQFLGKVIRLTPSHRVKIEDKPEVQKSGGVYYTPKYIVDYIVKNTIGEKLKNQSPKNIEKLKIVDPSCGSGSFLIVAFQYLIDWHINWYSRNEPEKWIKKKNPPIYKNADFFSLTTFEKKKILTNNIFGVDIDSQAVEVTKLSLLLKVLEDEKKDTLDNQLRLFHERALPNLSKNIKCGNSLIGSDFYENEQLNLLNEEEQLKINVFDWESAFSNIFNRQNPGFDVVIGNPPYRRELDYKKLMDEIALTNFGKKYRMPRMNLWYYFVHKGLELLRSDGKLSFIVNSYWTGGTGAEKLIDCFANDVSLEEIFNLGKAKVFENVSGQHMILRLNKKKSKKSILIKQINPTITKSAQLFVEDKRELITFNKKAAQVFRHGKVDLQDPKEIGIIDKIELHPNLDNYGIIKQGIVENPSSINKKTNQAYNNKWNIGDGVFVLTPQELELLKLPINEQIFIRPYYALTDITRYYTKQPSKKLIYITKKNCPNINKFPVLREHLINYKPIMLKRRETQKKSNFWWNLHWARDENIWKSKKILSLQMAKRPSFAPVGNDSYVPFSVNVFINLEKTAEENNYISAILNSKLLWLWFRHYARRRGVGLEINGNVFKRTPIRKIDFSNPTDKKCHQQMTKYVDRMLELHKRLEDIKNPYEKKQIQNQISATDKAIDKLVYNLYQLTEKEVKIVEESL